MKRCCVDRLAASNFAGFLVSLERAETLASGCRVNSTAVASASNSRSRETAAWMMWERIGASSVSTRARIMMGAPPFPLLLLRPMKRLPRKTASLNITTEPTKADIRTI